jgi:hypothetical protein
MPRKVCNYKELLLGTHFLYRTKTSEAGSSEELAPLRIKRRLQEHAVKWTNIKIEDSVGILKTIRPFTGMS